MISSLQLIEQSPTKLAWKEQKPPFRFNLSEFSIKLIPALMIGVAWSSSANTIGEIIFFAFSIAIILTIFSYVDDTDRIYEFEKQQDKLLIRVKSFATGVDYYNLKDINRLNVELMSRREDSYKIKLFTKYDVSDLFGAAGGMSGLSKQEAQIIAKQLNDFLDLSIST